jgi:hypothetical protein
MTALQVANLVLRIVGLICAIALATISGVPQDVDSLFAFFAGVMIATIFIDPYPNRRQ